MGLLKKNNDPRVFYDIEMCKSLVAGYGTKWEYKVMQVVRYQEIMCYSYKRKGDRKATFVNRWDFKDYPSFLLSLSELLSGQIAIGHNSIGFDNRMANTEFIRNRVPIPEPYKSVDTCLVARRTMKAPSNSLNDLAKMLGLKPKETTGNAELEEDWMTGKPSKKTVKLMKLYNNRDVDLLEEVYDILLPLINNHPNMGEALGKKMVCHKCGSPELAVHKERTRANGNTVIQYQCILGHYTTDPTVKKTGLLRNA